MTDKNGAPFPARPWVIALPAAGVVGVLILAATMLAAALPSSLANLAASVSDGVSGHEVSADGVRAEVVAPEGWLVVRRSTAELVVQTPDGGLSATVEPVRGEASARVQRLLDRARVSEAPISEERLADGRVFAHASDGDGVVFAAVVVSEGGAVDVVARVEPTDDAPRYRAAVAQLLGAIGP